MENDIKNKEYNIKEAVAYYILAYRRYSKKNHKKGLQDVLKYVLEEAKENINMDKIEGVNNDLLKIISFNWNLTSDDLLAYATCIFYVLMNRKEKITEEKIVKEFLSELHTHHPRRTVKEAEIILVNLFPDLKN